MASSANKLIIHIGLPKTGTKSLQAFLWEFREPISAAGLYYPVSGCVGHAHHNIYRYYSQDAKVKSRFDPSVGGEVELNNEIRQVNKDVLLSSESFWSLARHEPERFAEFISNVAAGRKVMFLVTWRNAAEYCESLYFQRAKVMQMPSIDKVAAMFFSIPDEFERVVTFLSNTIMADTLIIQYSKDMTEAFVNMMSTHLNVEINRELKARRVINASLSPTQKVIAAHLSLSKLRFDKKNYRRILNILGEGTSKQSGGEERSIMSESLQAKLIERSVEGLKNILKNNTRVTLYPERLPDHFKTRPYLMDDKEIFTFPKLRSVLEHRWDRIAKRYESE
jgi:hypothetical protein